jgi:glycosyltransferase involved in cell wall biosynthesis
MNAADCLLLTSDAEGSPTVIQEALACNLPVVSVDAGDTAERLHGVHRARIVDRNPQTIALALVDLLSSPGRSDGRKKLGEFSARRIAHELRLIYLQQGTRSGIAACLGPGSGV